MKRPSDELIARCSLVFTFMVMGSIFGEWVFVQFVHYHRQNRVLSPADISFDLATKEDYAKLSDPAVREFKYADGRYFIKAPAFDELRLASYYAASVDGKFYVKVSSKGTAAFLSYWYKSMTIVLISAIWALVFNFWNYRNLLRLSQPAATTNESDPAVGGALPTA